MVHGRDALAKPAELATLQRGWVRRPLLAAAAASFVNHQRHPVYKRKPSRKVTFLPTST